MISHTDCKLIYCRNSLEATAERLSLCQKCFTTSVFVEWNVYFLAVCFKARSFFTLLKHRGTPCYSCGFHMHSCRPDCAAIRPQMSPQENFWVLCSGAPRKTLNPSGFYFLAILVSWSGQSGTLSPKERQRA